MRVEKEWSPLIKQMWTAAVVGGMMALWQQRNSMTLGNANPQIAYCHKFITSQVQLAARLFK
ncbi:hypothetical protein FRX31_004583, partial [Thalictrum thalictroides]